MITTVNISKAEVRNIDELVDMALKLWPDNSREDLKGYFTYVLGHLKNQVFLAEYDNKYVGFIHVAIRENCVEGSSAIKVGYIEGIYIEPDYRNKGIEGELYKEGVHWIKSKGHSQVATDIGFNNEIAYNFYKDMGFKEVNKLIYFIKDL